MILKLLKKVCEALEERDLSYMLSGSIAMNIYTVPRMTRDIDIVINLTLSDINKFTEIFKEGFYFYEKDIRDEVARRGMFNVIDFESGQKIDFIIRKNTEFHINEFERKVKTDAYGFDVWIVSIEDLIISKLNWIQQLKSDTQTNDIRNLIGNPEADMNYIKKWINKLKLNTFNLFDDV